MQNIFFTLYNHYEKKWVFYNWSCNSIFELQCPLASHCIFMLCVIKQVA